MKLSIVIPTRNRARLLARFLSSFVDLDAALYEIIICDNGSTDETARVCRSFSGPLPIAYHHFSEFVPLEHNAVRGIKLARGDHVWMLGDDDWLDARFLREVLANEEEVHWVVIPTPADRHLQIAAHPDRPGCAEAPAVAVARRRSMGADDAIRELGTWTTFLGALIYRREDLLAAVAQYLKPGPSSNIFFSFATFDILKRTTRRIVVVDGGLSYRNDNSGGYSMFSTWVEGFLEYIEHVRSHGLDPSAVASIRRRHEYRFLPSMALNARVGKAFCSECSLGLLLRSPLSRTGKVLLASAVLGARLSRHRLRLLPPLARRLSALRHGEGPLGAVRVLAGIAMAKLRAWSVRLSGPSFASLGNGHRIRGARGLVLGSGVTMGRNAWVEAITTHRGSSYRPVLRIGSRVSANDDVHIAAVQRVDIGDDCLLGSRIIITDHNHGGYGAGFHSDPATPPSDRALVAAPVAIGAGTWIGDGAVILPGTTIGSGCVIGANAVVSGTIPDRSLAVGIPARVVKRFSPLRACWMAVPADGGADLFAEL